MFDALNYIRKYANDVVVVIVIVSLNIFPFIQPCNVQRQTALHPRRYHVDHHHNNKRIAKTFKFSLVFH